MKLVPEPVYAELVEGLFISWTTCPASRTRTVLRQAQHSRVWDGNNWVWSRFGPAPC
jgi:hypothetical protein